ncbi:hypothetical protein [Bdellovibrio sp. HCB209]|uniref:hypothetical protein n=1 Tax=Bdellovibrio sp. HCB209 TaxID=3394354 RepID=UPI0039B51661
MWIIFKLLFTLGAFLLRYSNARFNLKMNDAKSMHEGVELFTNVINSKNGIVRKTSWNRQFPCKVVFKLTRESKLDKILKNWGLADEIQTQDLSFDQLIYIACDSNSFMHKIQKDRETRRLITEIFANGCDYILCDGKTLCVMYDGERRSDFAGARLFAQLSLHLEELQKLPRDFDPFVIKALITESLIWSLAAYTLASFFQWTMLHETVYLNDNVLAKSALLFTGFASLVSIGIVLSLFRGSSRGHRIIVESVLVLALCLPVGGIALYSDMNINFDHSPTTTIDAAVTGHYTQMHRRRRGTHYITYHLQIDPQNSPKDIVLPLDLKISGDLYERTQLGSKIRIDVGRGRWHHAWIRGITAI